MSSRRPAMLTLAPLFLSVAVLAACGGNDDASPAATPAPPAPTPLLTLDGSVPLVIGHRGLPGLYPEETLPAYEGAADAGADSLEEDVHMTKDCVLVARHNPWLSDNTNITDRRRRRMPTIMRRASARLPGVKVAVGLLRSDLGRPHGIPELI